MISDACRTSVNKLSLCPFVTILSQAEIYPERGITKHLPIEPRRALSGTAAVVVGLVIDLRFPFLQKRVFNTVNNQNCCRICVTTLYDGSRSSILIDYNRPAREVQRTWTGDLLLS